MSKSFHQRSVLSPKHSNVSSPSPKKNKLENPFHTCAKLSNDKYLKSSPSPKKAVLGFTIYEDHKKLTETQESVEGDEGNLNHNDQENILKPLKIPTKRTHRKPLGNLSIHDYPGYISYNDFKFKSQLSEVFQPKNYDNEFKSLHKQLDLLSYVTPPRNSRQKYLAHSYSDDVEDSLVGKSKIIRRKRSMSVGRNESKLNLITKNKFNILAN
ncbi:uncharacterized protein PRCAT00000178001 [Priceomyces carsonii]|uniref:uncharacterized protein n=1 Tax=Priceomyces carsonii TaxID=28549 RepID=UPI002EDB78D8|nr:unnamed protein product [Priceomyces carsonii]